MSEPELYESVCPNCDKPFDLVADVVEAHCPHCDALLRFEAEEPRSDAPPAATKEGSSLAASSFPPVDQAPEEPREAEEATRQRQEAKEAKRAERERRTQETEAQREEERRLAEQARALEAEARRAKEDEAQREAEERARLKEDQKAEARRLQEEARRRKAEDRAAARAERERTRQEKKRAKEAERQARQSEKERRRQDKVLEKASRRPAAPASVESAPSLPDVPSSPPEPALVQPGPTAEAQAQANWLLQERERLDALSRPLGETAEFSPPADAPAFEPAPVALDGLPVTCPSCASSFHVASAATQGTCPVCSTRLEFENQYPQVTRRLPVACPACQASHEVNLQETSGACPQCGTALRYDDVPFGVPPPIAVGPTESAKEIPAVSRLEPPAADAPIEASAAPPTSPVREPAGAKWRLGRFRSGKTTAASGSGVPSGTSEPLPAELPHALVPPGGIPYLVQCPGCSKEFQLAPNEREGNCPHCNAPLAFLTEKESFALQAAEERKRAFQTKLQQRRLQEKQREEARVARTEARRQAGTPRPESSAAPGALAPSKRAWARWRSRREETAPAPSAPAEVPSAPLRTEPKPDAPQKLSRWRRPLRALRREGSEPPQRAETPLATPLGEAPAEIPLASVPPLKRRGKKATIPEPLAIDVEVMPDVGAEGAAPTPEVARKPWFRRRKTPPPAAERPIVAAAEIPPPPEPVPGAEPSKKRRWFGRRATTSREPAAPSAEVDVAGIEIVSPVPPEEPSPLGAAPPAQRSKRGRRAPKEEAPLPTEIPAAPPEPGPSEKKGGWLSRLRAPKEPKDEPPSATIEVATIDLGDFGGPPPQPPPEAPPAPLPEKPPRRAKHEPEPSPESPPSPEELAPTSPSEPAPPKRGFLERFRRPKASPPDAPIASVEVGSIDFGDVPVLEAQPSKPEASELSRRPRKKDRR